MKKKIIPVVVIAIVGVAAFTFWRSSRNGVENRIVLSGNIELTEVDVAFKVPGKLTERAVDEGDRVQKGQILARLSQSQLTEQRKQADAMVDMAESQLAQARTAAAFQKETQSADLAARKADVDSMEAKLKELKTGSRPEEIADAAAAVSAAQADATRTQQDWVRAQQLFKEDDISKAHHDLARAQNDASQARFRQSRERQRLVQTGPRAEVIEAQTAQVARARATVRSAEAAAMETRRREQEITTRLADVQRARAQLSTVDTQLDDTIATAPTGGIVLVKAADPGEVIAAGTTVLTIGDLGKPWLRAYISESQLGRVKIGMAARVTTDSHPGKVYNGRVSFISSEAEFTPKQIQTAEERLKLVYRIKIDIDNPDGELKSNMPADAELVLP